MGMHSLFMSRPLPHPLGIDNPLATGYGWWVMATSWVIDQIARTVTLRLPLRLVNINNTREHHMVLHRRESRHRFLARVTLEQATREARRWLVASKVTITRVAPRKMDDDGCVASAKSVRDGVADALGVDDGDPSITWSYAQQKGGARGRSVPVGSTRKNTRNRALLPAQAQRAELAGAAGARSRIRNRRRTRRARKGNLMTTTTDHYPFVVRLQDGRERRAYFADAQQAALCCALEFESPIVLIVRADEPFVRYPSLLRRFVDWVES